MRRLIRALAEIESYRDSLMSPVWKTPGDMAAIALLNTSIALLTQAEHLAPRKHPGIDSNPDRVSALIRQINDELRDDEDAA